METQTLTFNTTTKSVTLYSSSGNLIFSRKNIPTVQVKELGFYEVMYKPDENSSAYPILRVPIFNTIMFIEK